MKLSEGGTITLSKPEYGWTTLTIGDCIISEISYVDPDVVYGIFDWLRSFTFCEWKFPPGKKYYEDNVCELDCEGLYAYLIKTNLNEIIVVREGVNSLNSIVYFDYVPCDKVFNFIKSFIDSVDENFVDWIDWELGGASEYISIKQARENLSAALDDMDTYIKACEEERLEGKK